MDCSSEGLQVLCFLFCQVFWGDRQANMVLLLLCVCVCVCVCMCVWGRGAGGRGGGIWVYVHMFVYGDCMCTEMHQQKQHCANIMQIQYCLLWVLFITVYWQNMLRIVLDCVCSGNRGMWNCKLSNRWKSLLDLSKYWGLNQQQTALNTKKGVHRVCASICSSSSTTATTATTDYDDEDDSDKMMMMMILTFWKAQLEICYNLITIFWIVSDTYAHGPNEQLCGNHRQGIRHCVVCHMVRRRRSACDFYRVDIAFIIHFISLAENSIK